MAGIHKGKRGVIGDAAHEHQFAPAWQSDCTLVSWCNCGEKRECDIKELQESQRSCINLRAEYLGERNKSSSKAKLQELAKAVAVKDKQIAWLERQIEGKSLPNSSASDTPTQYLALDEIRRDGGTQPRAAIDLKHVLLLEEQMEDGKELDPVTVFYDSESYWLADGFHRAAAHRNQGREAIACIIHQGSRRDAVLYSVGANADHRPALPRSRGDKLRAVMTLLQDPEWGKWSDREIARQCRVSDKTVGSLRKSICGNSADTKLNIERKAQRGDKTYTVNTAKIGKTARTTEELQLLGNRVTVTADHPLFPGQSGTITQFPNPDSAIVELDTGERELINLKHLKPSVAHHLKLNEGGLVEIYAPENNKIHGRRGRIASVASSTAEVWLRDVDTMTMQRYTLKYQQVKPLPLEKEPQLKQVCDRLTRLRECGLDPFEVQVLALYDQPVAFTPVELEYLAHIERRYGVIQNN